ncbi:MAG: hypothetical protein HC786_20830 [Richelia sp. CSU_2_1]|nr:hypothetical protein [Richelia sp. CSU_2_1]
MDNWSLAMGKRKKKEGRGKKEEERRKKRNNNCQLSTVNCQLSRFFRAISRSAVNNRASFLPAPVA